MSETPDRRAIRDTGIEGNASIEKDRLREYRRQYHIDNREKILLRVREHYHANKDKRLAYGKQWRAANPDKMNAYRRTSINRLRKETFEAYGGNICACCGESEPKFLTIDHMNGGGNKHRRSIGNTGGKDFYSWLRKSSYPEGYQVLCYNCNMSKGHYGVCPHTLNIA